MKKTRRRILTVIIVLIIIGILAIAALLFWLLGGIPTRYTSAEDYGKHQEFVQDGDLLLFPKEIEKAQEPQFYFKYSDTFLNPTVQIYLKCKYDEDTYEQECARLKDVSITWKEETQRTFYDEEHFSLPGYVAVYETQKYEYALLDEEKNTIVYVCMRFLEREQVGFPEECLPENYQNGTVDISEEKNIYKFGVQIIYGDMSEE